MFLQLTLTIVLLALPGNSQDDYCIVSQRRDVRLRGGTEYAGRVEVCWRAFGQVVYKWLSVCTNMWGIDEARAVCHKLGYNNSRVTGLLQCGRESCFGHGQDDKVILSCRFAVHCTMNSIYLSDCDDSTPAVVICDLPPLEEEVPSTSQACGCTSTTTPCPTITQESLEGENTVAMATKSCDSVGGVLGVLIIAMVIVLVGMNLGWAWFYHRISGKQRIKEEMEISNEAQISNPTYDVPTYDMIRPSGNHTPSVIRDNLNQRFSHTLSLAGTYDSTEHNHQPNHHPLKNGKRNTLELTSMVENTDKIYHVLEPDQNYATINKNGQNYATALKTEATPTIDNEYGKLQH